MGAFWLSRSGLIATLSEIVGYKSGVALDGDQIAGHLDEEHREHVVGDDDELLRIRVEHLEELVRILLYRTGNISTDRLVVPGMSLHHKYKGNPVAHGLLERVFDLFYATIPGLMAQAEAADRPVILVPFVDAAAKALGSEGGRLALEFAEQLELSVHQSPWSRFRQVEWSDEAELTALFRSENLETAHGRFFDQRFIDYLDRNFESIDSINWRRFEGLAAEYFARLGCHVEIGPGRDDGGVDIRVWPTMEADPGAGPPALLVQCKREARRVSKVVVKALWADVVAEDAKSGLIVTTTSLSPGAEAVRRARAYPIREANRESLRRWILMMRSPQRGVFLGE